MKELIRVFKRDNGRDHRAATSDSPFQNARTSPLRVHRIVMHRSVRPIGKIHQLSLRRPFRLGFLQSLVQC